MERKWGIEHIGIITNNISTETLSQVQEKLKMPSNILPIGASSRQSSPNLNSKGSSSIETTVDHTD